jgi:hypothetical protein
MAGEKEVYSVDSIKKLIMNTVLVMVAYFQSSEDEKPTTGVMGNQMLLEYDTATVYRFDDETQSWIATGVYSFLPGKFGYSFTRSIYGGVTIDEPCETVYNEDGSWTITPIAAGIARMSEEAFLAMTTREAGRQYYTTDSSGNYSALYMTTGTGQNDYIILHKEV